MSAGAELQKAVERLKAGDKEGFSIFYQQTYQYVYSRAKFTVSDEHETLDLMQEVYLAAYKNISSLNNTESVFSWLGGITLRQGMKMLAKKRKTVLLSGEQDSLFEVLPDEESGAEERVAKEEEVQVIKECIYELSEEQRVVILAYYYDEMKVGEIAELLEISEGTVKSRLFHARKHLKDSLTELEKKQGYKLYSVSVPVILAAVRGILDENSITADAAGWVYTDVCAEVGLWKGNPFHASGAAKGKHMPDAVSKTAVEKAAGEAAEKVTAAAVKNAAGMASGAAKGKAILIALGILAGTAVTGAAGYVWYQAVETAEEVDVLTAEKERASSQQEETEELKDVSGTEDQETQDVQADEADGRQQTDGDKPKDEKADGKQVKFQDPLTYYADVLEEYRQAELSGYSGQASQYRYVISGLLEYDPLNTWFTYEGQPLYYSIVDINGDGRPELFLSLKNGASERGQIIDIYGYGENGPEKITFGPEDVMDGRYKAYDICENGILCKYAASDSLTVQMHYYYTLPANSTYAQFVDGIFMTGDMLCQRRTETDSFVITQEEYKEILYKNAVISDTSPYIEWIKLNE